ncbi:PREDICTED: cell cycle checkpoint control protein RAD9A-like [Amphimedon queenslandica]|uniref:Cell cycle checkpoint control protein n=1 Tax=Amphimedon queenslandica TaxID=400682 RepID=A0AAN0J6Q0_AMPQE|nr:PREDICTED: cell cycle checkpoint control protein RAD9A-like [Amphimedon queenslandica]|eukprot:XP_019852704.1 PREDICTED: cell cycle checkpoint control protein RAD9A-like [Amphimedon queenslandica]
MMKCFIPDTGIHAFGKAIHCLCKIGEEIFIETRKHGLSFKTVNSARSAYACFEFKKSFFDSYRIGADSSVLNGEGSIFCCKVLSKCLLLIFRALSSLEKTVNQCQISIDSDSSTIAVIFLCKHGITKRHRINYNDCEMLKAVYNKENCFNHLGGVSSSLSEVVVNFPNSQDEVTLVAMNDKIQLKNYNEDFGDSRSISTEIYLLSEEFDSFEISKETSVTFCLKELRALLAFTDSLDDCLNINFNSCGSPVVFSIDDNPQYTADVVLASLMDNQEEEPTQQETNISATIEATSVHQTLNHDDSPYIPDNVSQIYVPLKDLERTCVAGTNETDLRSHQNEPHQLSYATTSHAMDSLLLDDEKEILTADRETPAFKPLVNISNNSQYKGSSNRRSLEPVPSEFDDDKEFDCSGVVPSTPPPLKKVRDTCPVLRVSHKAYE